MALQLKKIAKKINIMMGVAILVGLSGVFASALHAESNVEKGMIANPSAGHFEMSYFGFDGTLIESLGDLEATEVFFSKLGEKIGASFSEAGSEELGTLKVIGKPLNYPNPFRAKSGTEIGILLNHREALEVQVYNMLGRKVVSKQIEESGLRTSVVTSEGVYYKIKIDEDDVMGEFSAGAYFYLIMKDGKVLAKGKMAVLP